MSQIERNNGASNCKLDASTPMGHQVKTKPRLPKKSIKPRGI
jgi:hypothetical protein